MSTSTLTARIAGARPGPWTAFLLRRTGRLGVSLAALVTASFAMIHFVPGDPVRGALGIAATPEAVATREHALGLDRSLPSQYRHFVTGLFHGDLGESITTRMPVSDLIGERLPATMEIALAAFVLVMLVAIPLGMAAAVYTRNGRRRRGELAFIGTTGAISAIPEFLLAVGLTSVFAVSLGWFPVALRDGPDSYVLPVLALSIAPIASLARIVRVEALRVFEADYMRTARAKRLPARLVYLRHALPNLLTSSLTLGGLLLGGLLAGTVLVENVFAWPGLGMTIVQAIIQKDYPLVQGVVLVYGAAALLINFAVDCAVALADPKSTIRGS
ncbi:ABC transporter permease [Embleya sp. NBC_00896]|uniref:ABC transporter permease n=1 Tax=Embleya sp. NBC_00896 TaxID=2975961 RepID=UPI00386AA046|nr:ABC transporter permease [Embleya sp. NBC_00896]